MPRKLKTYTTSAGFFDLAIAAPSMKAALEAWGSNSNLFQQGFAKESDDPQIVADTMARPGVVLRRAVGTNGRFSEHAELPSSLPARPATRKPEKAPTRKDKPPASRRIDEKTARQAAFAFEEEQRRRERQAKKEEAEWKRDQKRRDRAIAAARAALDKAEQDHKARTASIEKARAALDRKQEAEDARWKKQRERLEEALRKARPPTHLRVVSNR